MAGDEGRIQICRDRLRKGQWEPLIQTLQETDQRTLAEGEGWASIPLGAGAACDALPLLLSPEQ